MVPSLSDSQMSTKRNKSAHIPESLIHAKKAAESRPYSDSLMAISKRYLSHQNPKVTAESHSRAEGIIDPKRRNRAIEIAKSCSPSDSFEFLARRYLEYQKRRITAASYKREQGILARNLSPFFGEETPLSGISQLDVRKYVESRKRYISAASITKELSVVKHLFALAVEWRAISTNPGNGVKSPPLSAAKLRYLKPFEMQQIVGASPDWLKPIINLALATAMTRSELLEMHWRDVDLKRGTIVVVRKRLGQSRTIPLNNLARHTLAPMARIKPNADGLVFTGRSISKTNVSQAFHLACRSVGIFDVRFQDLRHTAASWMALHGIDIQTVSRFLGHVDLRMAERYQHLNEPSLLDAVKTIDGILNDPMLPQHPGRTTRHSIDTVTSPRVPMARRWELTDEEWEVVEPALQEERRADKRGRPWRDSRSVLHGVLWVLGSGAQWRELPEKYPPFQTCHRRFQHWIRSGKLEEALKLLARHLYKRGKLNLDEAFVDATFASATKGASQSAKHAMGTSPRSSSSPLATVFLAPYLCEALHQSRASLWKSFLPEVFSTDSRPGSSAT
jgi:integrase/transposase